jgi:hypothetical protein
MAKQQQWTHGQWAQTWENARNQCMARDDEDGAEYTEFLRIQNQKAEDRER